jgi:hypothetical protein
MRDFPNRIRAVRGNTRGLTPENFQEEFRIAYGEPASCGKAGHVVLNAVVGKDGKVLELSPREGDPQLAAAAMEAVRHWVYRPLLLNGRQVEVATEIDVSFTS